MLVIAFLFISYAPQSDTSSLLPNLGRAAELRGINSWINSQPLKIEDLKGKVVLVDFWTYSCINCIRTLPYLNDWHQRYADQGLVIIGVHTPEFEFEKDYNNVKAAVDKYEIKYAVAMDNDYATWRAYKNNFWPRKYLIDKEGNIRYDHIGEGAYEETEKVIQELLGEIKQIADTKITSIESDVNFSQILTPELYLGYDFARDPLGNDEGFSPGDIVDYKYRNLEKDNTIYLSGSWKNEPEKTIAVNNSKLFLRYTAKSVNIVAGGTSKIVLILDGKPLQENQLGKDAAIENGSSVGYVNGNRLYNIVSTPDYETHLLEIQALPGFEIYTFTFG